MGYRIDYQPLKRQKPKKPVRIFAAIVVLLALCLTANLFPDVRHVFYKFLFPGDTAVAVAAISDLRTDLEFGLPFWDAMQGFFIQVICQ